MSLSKDQIGNVFGWPKNWETVEELNSENLEKLDNNVIISLYKHCGKRPGDFSTLFHKMVPVPEGKMILIAQYFNKKIRDHWKKCATALFPF